MRIIKKKIYSLTLALFLSSTTFAEDISLCKGVWTSKPCTEAEKSFEATNKPKKEKIEQEKVIQEKDLDTTAADNVTEEIEESEDNALAKEKSKNESMVHDLKIKSIDIKEKYGSQYDLRLLEQTCNKDAITSKSCNKMIAEETTAIREYELRLREIALEEEKLKREEEGNKTENTTNIAQVNNTVTQVKQNIQSNTVVGSGIIQNSPSTMIKKHIELVPKAEPKPSPKSEIIRSINNVTEIREAGR